MGMAASTTAASSAARRPRPRLPYELILHIAQFVIGDAYAAITREDGMYCCSWRLGVQATEGRKLFLRPELYDDIHGRLQPPFQLLQAISQVDVALRREVLKHFTPFLGTPNPKLGPRLAWIASGDKFRVGFDLRSWWSLQQSLAQLSTFEKQILGTIQEVQLSNLKWTKSLYGEIGDAGIERFLQILPNLQRILVGIPRTRDCMCEEYSDDDLFPLSRDRDSFADQTAIPPILAIIWAAGVKTLAYNASDLAIFDTV